MSCMLCFSVVLLDIQSEPFLHHSFVNHVCAYGCVVADHLSTVLTTVFP